MSPQRNRSEPLPHLVPSPSSPAAMRRRVLVNRARLTVLVGAEHEEALRALATLMPLEPSVLVDGSQELDTLLGDQPRHHAA